jgi:arginase family enzyme
LDTPNCIDFIKRLTGPIHISFDVDALDPSLVDSTGTMVPGGLMADEVREIIKTALDENKLVSLDVVEFNKHLGNPDFSIKAVKDVFEANNDSATIEPHQTMSFRS